MPLAKLKAIYSGVKLALDLNRFIVSFRRAQFNDNLLAPYAKFGRDFLKFEFVFFIWHQAELSFKNACGSSKAARTGTTTKLTRRRKPERREERPQRTKL